MIDVSREDRGGTCAVFFSNGCSRGRRLFIYTLLMSQWLDTSETITLGVTLCVESPEASGRCVVHVGELF